jgi:hypothetical protein
VIGTAAKAAVGVATVAVAAVSLLATNGVSTATPAPLPPPDEGYVCLSDAAYAEARDALLNDPIATPEPADLPEADGDAQLIVVSVPDTPQGRAARLGYLDSNQERCP